MVRSVKRRVRAAAKEKATAAQLLVFLFSSRYSKTIIDLSAMVGRKLEERKARKGKKITELGDCVYLKHI